MKKYFILIFAIILCVSCENFPESVYAIRVRNNSTYTISVCAGFLQDTLLPVNKPTLIEISAGKSGLIYDTEVGDKKFKKLESERIKVFILNNDTIIKYDWNTITSKYKILKRFEFNRDELTGLGGSVVFI